MKKQYTKPSVTIFKYKTEMLLISSYRCICNDRCKMWHTCLDRMKGKVCTDKKS